MKDSFDGFLIFITLMYGLSGLSDVAESIDRAQWRQVYWLKVAAQKEGNGCSCGR